MSYEINIIPCNHNSIKECNCLSKKEKNNFIFRYHKHYDCNNYKHSEIKYGYYKVLKPTWKYSCHNFKYDRFGLLTRIEKLCDIFEIKCYCTTLKICNLCELISEMDITLDDNYLTTIRTLFNQLCFLKEV